MKNESSRLKELSEAAEAVHHFGMLESRLPPGSVEAVKPDSFTRATARAMKKEGDRRNSPEAHAHMDKLMNTTYGLPPED